MVVVVVVSIFSIEVFGLAGKGGECVCRSDIGRGGKGRLEDLRNLRWFHSVLALTQIRSNDVHCLAGQCTRLQYFRSMVLVLLDTRVLLHISIWGKGCTDHITLVMTD